MRSSEKWGVDVETAVDLALKELKISRDEAEIEVLEESSNGFLGIGSKLARVRVTAKEAEPAVREKATFDDIDAILAGLPENSAQKLPDEVRAEYDKFEAEEREDARAREKARSKEKSRSKSKKRYSLSLEDTMLYEVKKLDPAKDHPLEKFLRDIAEQMGVDLDFSVKAGDELVFVEITGKDTGTIIGKRGATLDAVQCLASYVVNKEGRKDGKTDHARAYESLREKGDTLHTAEPSERKDQKRRQGSLPQGHNRKQIIKQMKERSAGTALSLSGFPAALFSRSISRCKRL